MVKLDILNLEKEFLDKIPENATTIIWGAGTTGKCLKSYIDKNRKDVVIKGFIDRVKIGEFEGLKVFKPEDLKDLEKQIDVILVSILDNSCKMEFLSKYYKKIYLQIPKELCNFYRIINSDDYLTILNNLETQEDKKIYSELIKLRCTYNYEFIKDYVRKKFNISQNEKEIHYNHYLDFINKNVIKNVIDAGIADGRNSLAFMTEFENLNKIYAFDPIYQKYDKNSVFSHIIDNSQQIEIIEKGLWNEEAKLKFLISHHNIGSRVISNDDGSELSNLIEIGTISVDDFCEKNQIKKIDFIKMDIEGSELNALIGAQNTIAAGRPQLAISIYHTNQDIVQIPLYLIKTLKDYIFKIEHYRFDLCETVLYAIPKELYSERQ